MSQPNSYNNAIKQVQQLKQTQRLVMSPHMQQAIRLLQVPIMELSEIVEEELEQNPILEYSDENHDEDPELSQLEDSIAEIPEQRDLPPDHDVVINENDFEMLQRLDEDFSSHFNESDSNYSKMTSHEEKLKNYLENSLKREKSLFEYLMEQAKATFDTNEQLAAAEELIGNIDRKGLITTSLQEISLISGIDISILETILKEIQNFDPPGIAAKNLRESLLNQLRIKNKESSLAYKIVDQCYEDLLHNRISNIKRTLHCTAEQINRSIKEEIVKLDVSPGAAYSKECPQQIIPDINVIEEDNKLVITVNEDHVPQVKLNSKYLKMLNDPSLNQETHDFIKEKIRSAKWLMKNIFQRNSTIERIGEYLARYQQNFFMNPNGKLQPLTMKEVAEELELHESTIARAVANKYLHCDRGIFPLRYFFSNAYVNDKGRDISAKTVKQFLQELIDNEDNRHPLSDEILSKMMKERGISCARRTIAKYRAEMVIGTAQQRKKYE